MTSESRVLSSFKLFNERGWCISMQEPINPDDQFQLSLWSIKTFLPAEVVIDGIEIFSVRMRQWTPLMSSLSLFLSKQFVVSIRYSRLMSQECELRLEVVGGDEVGDCCPGGDCLRRQESKER